MIDRSVDKQHEQLSALLDGELSAAEQDALVNLLGGNPAMRRQLARYQLVHAQLQQECAQLVDASAIADQVRTRLGDEPTVLAPPVRRGPSNLPRVALGAALAAGVAAVTVAVAPHLLDSDPTSSPETFAFTPRLSVPAFDPTTVALGGPAVDPSAQTLDTGQRWKVLEPRLQRKLDTYLLEHNEFAGRLGVHHPSVHVGFISTRDAQR